MRSPVDTIAAPSFPKNAAWVNVAPLRMEKQARHPVLIEFWDVCRPSCVRTLPYLRAWHERYAAAGLRVIGVHASGFPAGRDEDRVREAIARLDIDHPVLLDPDFLLWRAYAAPGWPSRYLFAPRLRLFEVHHGEGDYHGTERAIQELLGTDEPLTPLVDPADDDDVPIVVPTADVEGPYAGAYAAGEVWVVVDGPATITVNGEDHVLDRLGAHRVIHHDRHTAGELRIAGDETGAVLATAFLPGLA
jgi:thiol-disulfide isomerase/thioredoxin